MPLGYERLNERTQRPNVLINFIKPLEGADKATAEDFLNRIAAQAYPVMKAAHISVMSLEEYEPNSEFLGRNFNAGECIQLVLKDKSGRWLGFKFVQMVMMHELAHCKQMNHSKFFWQVRNQYAQDMYDLWAKKYRGEGIWGRGHDLTSGRIVEERPMAEGDVPEHLCGGTYRRRGRKRKRGTAVATDGQRPTYAERQQRRIAKKFGRHGDGNALGEDDLVRGALEQGHRHQGKPRVANSKRGRELRAQAALARFEAVKVQQSKPDLPDDADNSDVEWSDSETEDESVVDGNGYVKVCDGEDDESEDASKEMHEMLAVTKALPKKDDVLKPKPSVIAGQKSPSPTKEHRTQGEVVNLEDDSTPDVDTLTEEPAETIDKVTSIDDSKPEVDTLPKQPAESTDKATSIIPSLAPGTCPICSMQNEAASLSCLACAHVLRPRLVNNTWRCQSLTCRGSAYINAGDAGRCGICGSAKPSVPTTPAYAAKPISADVLRWD